MPYTEHEDKSGGVTVTSKDSGKSFHAPSEAAAKHDEQLHEEFSHMKDAAVAEDGSAENEDGAASEAAAMPEQFAAAFHRRGYSERKKYQREETPVREEPVQKLQPVAANYRSAFSAARCAACAHFQSGSQTCELVAGPIGADSVCDLFQHAREDETEKANRLFAARG